MLESTFESFYTPSNGFCEYEWIAPDKGELYALVRFSEMYSSVISVPLFFGPLEAFKIKRFFSKMVQWRVQ